MQRLSLFVASVTLLALHAALPGSDDHSLSDLTTRSDGHKVEVSVQQISKGKDPADYSSTSTANTNNTSHSNPPAEPERSLLDLCRDSWEKDLKCFGFLNEEEAEEATEESPGIPAVTITDLAQFTPTPTSLTAEPFNVGVAGLPTNFVAPATAHTTSGTLFGYPIQVRFTPAEYHFDYGDGETAITTTGGKSWEALRLKQFDPTDTSHVYTDGGDYTSTVTVHYTAQVDFGTGWFTIPGTLTTTSPPNGIHIYVAHTALVRYTCDEDRTGIGCPQ